MKYFYNFLLLFTYIFLPVFCWSQEVLPFREQLRLASEVKDDSERLKALLVLERSVGNATALESVDFDKTLLATRIVLRDDSGAVASYLNLGQSYSNMSRYNEALYQFYTALPIAIRQKNHEQEAELYLGIAFIFKSLGETSGDTTELDKGLKYALTALNICHAYNLPNTEARSYGDIATIFDVRKMHRQAIYYYRKALEIAIRNRNTIQIITLQANLGISLKNNHQFEESLKSYEAAESLNDTLQDEFIDLLIGDNKSILFKEMGRMQDAEALGLKTLAIAKRLGFSPVKEDMYHLLSDIYGQTGRYRDAYEYGRQLQLIKDTLLNKQKTEQIAEMQTRFNSDLKDRQILERDATILSNQRRNVLTLLVLAMVAVIAVVIFAAMQRTRKLNKKVLLQQQELLQQQQALQELNTLKDRLFSVISHDLRTPVNSLTSFTMLLSDQDMPPEKMQQYLKALKQILASTTGLLDNLLNFARSEMGAYKPVMKPVDINGVIAGISELMAAVLSAKNISLDTQLEGCMVTGDEDMLAIIFRNLISNAIKYSKPGHAIRLYFATGKDKVFITIEDKGTGLPPEILKMINDPVSKEAPVRSKTGTADEKGTGLGLMLVLAYARKMNASVTAENNADGGASITLGLPDGL